MKSHDKPGKIKTTTDKEKPTEKMPKKTLYIKDIVPAQQQPQPPTQQQPEPTFLNEMPINTNFHDLPNCQHQQIVESQPIFKSNTQSLLPEALNPMNLINNNPTNSNNNYNSMSSHSTSSLLLPLPPHHEPPQITDHQIHPYPTYDNSGTTYLGGNSIIPNSFPNFIMNGLDFSKNSLNGEPTYIDY